MAHDEMAGALHIPARVLPAPKHLSPQAQRSLSANLYGDRSDYPPLDDKEAWRRNIAATDAMLAAVFESAISACLTTKFACIANVGGAGVSAQSKA
jgi:hypothetical protein